MAKDLDHYWEPDSAFRAAIGTLFGLNKGWFPVDHVPGLITAIRAVRSGNEIYKDQKSIITRTFFTERS